MFVTYACGRIYVYFKWGDKKLCRKGDEHKKPEFTDAVYFMMLFTCGAAVGMFFFGAAGPMTYYSGGSTRRFQNGALTNSGKAQWETTLTIFHWGLHGLIPTVFNSFPRFALPKALSLHSSASTAPQALLRNTPP